MYTIEQYYKDTKLLTNSLVIKLQDVALSINNGLTLYNNITVDSDKTTWKYYLNISGERHYNDPVVYITTIETGVTVALTKNVLNTYPTTKNELLKQDIYYNKLVSQYETMITYIRGCMFPVDIDAAIEAEDGTILAYNTKFVEPQEHDLIDMLQEFIKQFLSRWHIREYSIIDDLYMPSLVGILTLNAYTKITNLRLDNISTNKVHSFHMEHFFRSNLNLWDDIYVLNNETKYWLYKNLLWMKKNTGQNETLIALANKVFGRSGIGLGTIDIVRDEPTLSPSGGYVNGEYSGVGRGLNSVYSGSSELTIPDIVDFEINDVSNDVNKYTADASSYLGTYVNKQINSKTQQIQQTKILDIDSIKYINRSNGDLFGVIFSQLYYYSSNGAYTKTVKYYDTYSGITHTLEAIDACYVILKLMLSLTDKVNNTIHYIPLYPILSGNTISEQEITASMYNYHDTIPAFNRLMELLPTAANSISTTEELSNTIYDVINYLTYSWIAKSNAEDPAVSTNIGIMENVVFQVLNINGDNYTTYNKTIDAMLAERDITFDVPEGYDIVNSIYNIMYAFTGIRVNLWVDTDRLYKSCVSIINKLTSYSIHTIRNYDSVSEIDAHHSRNTVLKSNDTTFIATVLDASCIAPLEVYDTRVVTRGNNIIDRIRVLDTPVRATASSIPSSGNITIRYEDVVILPRPELTIYKRA